MDNSEEAVLPSSGHRLGNQLVDLDTRVVVVEPQARLAVAVVARVVGGAIRGRVVEGRVEGDSGVDNLRRDAAVLGREGGQAAGDGGVVLAYGDTLGGLSVGTVGEVDGGALDGCGGC